MPVDHVSSTAGYRHSYFQEAPMDEHTLANSSRDNVPAREGSSLARRLREFGSFHIDGSSTMTKILLRLVNGVTHLLFSFVLLAIMAEFMIRYKGRARWPQAIALTTLVATDCVLDIYYTIRLQEKWKAWATSLRLLLALGYLAQFLVYIGYRQVFPSDYAYWGMQSGYSDPVVYLLLWVIGIWNLLHTAVHRHSLGRDLRRWAHTPRSFRRQTTSTTHNQHAANRRPESRTAGTAEPMGGLTTVQSRGSPDEVAIDLDVLVPRDKKEVTIVSARVASPATAGASSSSSSQTAGEDEDESRRTSVRDLDGETLNAEEEARPDNVPNNESRS